MDDEKGKQNQDLQGESISSRMKSQDSSRAADETRGGGMVTLTYSELVDYVSEKAAEKLSTELKEQEEKRQGRTNLVLSLISVVGFTSIVALTNTVITNIVRTEINKATEAERANLRYEAKYQSFLASAIPLVEEDDASTDPDRLVDALRYLGGSVESLKERDEFPIFLHAALNSLWAEDRQQAMDELEPLFEPIVRNDPEIASLMLQFYGESVIGSVYPPQEHTRKLNKYINTTRDLDVHPGYPLLYRALYELKEADFKRNRKIDRLVEDITRLNPDDRKRFDRRVLHYSTCDWWDCDRGEAIRVTEAVQSLISLYPSLQSAGEPSKEHRPDSQERGSAPPSGVTQEVL